ncbi:MAG TPA: beta-ketoacyl synthase N-terminal-like domain-containing protein, partial [Thermoanaerobaculia bacterium]|nr:beta-ketoacyl synthase N-terminal-like domain-containing protein [Thermoanaerobaculia bacterium]
MKSAEPTTDDERGAGSGDAAGSGSGAAPGIAIIGMAGRFPGAPDVEQFWESLRAGRESIRGANDEELLAAGVAPRLLADPAY